MLMLNETANRFDELNDQVNSLMQGPVYLLTQYGQLYAVFNGKASMAAWCMRTIPIHLWSEYRVHVMPLGQTFIPGADNQHNLKDFFNDSSTDVGH